MIVPGLGEAAALATAACWASCVEFFGAAGQRIGSIAVNHLRLLGGVLLLCLVHVFLQGTAWPVGLPSWALLLFVLSGIIGLSLGDGSYFQAIVLVGPAISSLVMTFVPAIAMLLAFAFLGEVPTVGQLVGMSVTIAGVALAVKGRNTSSGADTRGPAGTRALVIGLLFALGGSFGQAAGVVLAKPALATCPAVSGTLVRLAAATVALWAFTGVRAMAQGRAPTWWADLGDRRALWLTLGGTITGPFLGVWLSLVATKHADVGVATTLMSTTPIIVLFLEWPLFGRRPSGTELLGAVVAVAGVAVLVGAG